MNDYESYLDAAGADDELELFGDGAPAQTGAETSPGDEEGMAWELLSVQNDAEMEAFLGKLFRSARRAATPMLGKLLRGGARSLLKRALPMIGGLAGSVIPGAGTALGSAAGSAMSQLIGSEAETLSEPDGQMEGARRLVRTIGEAASRLTTSPLASSHPRAAVTGAYRAAMQRHVPGLLGGRGASGGGNDSGRWVRRGDSIVILGA